VGCADTIVLNDILVVAGRSLSSIVSCALRFMLLNLACCMVENVLSHTHVLPNIEFMLSGKIFQFGKPISAD